MKIEICENTFWLSLWTVICLTAAICLIGSILLYNRRLETIVAAGYVEKMVDSQKIVVWDKP